MKVQGPGDTPITSAGEAAPSASVEAMQAVGESAAATPMRALALELEAGRITAQEAVQTVVDRVVSRLSGAASPETLERMRATLLEFIAHDPLLNQKVQRLGGER